MLCPKCNREVSDEYQFCSLCGEPVPSAPDAPAEVPDGEETAPLEEAADVTPNGDAEPDEAESNRPPNNKNALICVLLGVIGAFCSVLAFGLDLLGIIPLVGTVPALLAPVFALGGLIVSLAGLAFGIMKGKQDGSRSIVGILFSVVGVVLAVAYGILTVIALLIGGGIGGLAIAFAIYVALFGI